ncbi:MAG: sigma-54-dependent Fis family transcriptional regulator [Desulfovibrio sp.]|nr:sigma-54-dependent Fis family transcriptional regulator [Desulfovibrio sp.]
MDTGQLAGTLGLSDAVAGSWERCLEGGVDPQLPTCRIFAPEPVLAEQTEGYNELVKPLEAQIVNRLKGTGMLMTYADKNGLILRACGDKELLRDADSIGFCPGAYWTEKSIGTNAICLALDGGAPAQVLGEEHFCLGQKGWGCAAVPVFSPTGEIFGCFDISGGAGFDHVAALLLALQSARQIEHVLARSTLASMESSSRALMNSVFRTIGGGVLLLEEASGRITYASAEAERLLGAGLRGCGAGVFFDLSAYARERSQKGAPMAMRLACRTRPGLHAEIYACMEGGRPSGRAVIAVREGKPPLTVAMPAKRPEKSREDDPFAPIFRQAVIMEETVAKARIMARSDASILLHGETGTGKELFARAIHLASARAKGPFVAVNCAALPRELVQSELFGYAKGSFTGANTAGRPGKFEEADGGTLFLDEISEIPYEVQVNLLRPLEDHSITRIGGQGVKRLDFRLITATNRNLDEMMSQGRFREDLFFRVQTMTLEIPPLRDRREDIAPVAEHWCRVFCERSGTPFGGIAPEALDVLSQHAWPGNVRELVHAMEYACAMAQGGRIEAVHLPDRIRNRAQTQAKKAEDKVQEHDSQQWQESGEDRRSQAGQPAQRVLADVNLESLEAKAIQTAIESCHGNISKAAKALGIGRNTLYTKMRKYGIGS